MDPITPFSPAAIQPLIHTKLAPPRQVGAVVARTSLVDRLRENRHQTFVGIRAPAGAGKTTLVAAWRQQLIPLGFDVAWLTLTRNDDSAGRFLDYLIASLQQVDDSLAKEAQVLLRQRADTEPADAVVIALVNAIAQHRRELTLVIDDYHHVSVPAIHAALQLLLDYAPENLHLLVTSRSALPFDLARLRAQGRASDFDYRDLRFSFAETEAFLKQRIGDIARRDARLLYDRTDGWAAGLQLISIDLKRRSVAGPQLRTMVKDARDFAAYFRTQVLTQLPPEEIELLVKLSVCSRFTAALCAEVVRSDHVAALLQRVESDELFIVRYEESGQEPWYRVHPLLRELLLEDFRLRPASEQRGIHAAASTWFRRQGLMTEAIHHALDAGEHRQAAEMVESAARDMIWEGDPRRLAYFLEQLAQMPAGLSPQLQFWNAWLQFLHRRFDACAQLLAPIEASLPSEDGNLRRHVVLLRACLAIQNDDSAAMPSSCEQLRPLLDDPDGDLAGGARNLTGGMYLASLQLDRACEVLSGPRLSVAQGRQRLGSPFGWLLGRGLLGFAHAERGEIALAERILGAVLQESEQTLGRYAMPTCHAAAYFGDVLYEIDQVDAARSLLEDRLDVIDRIAMPDTLLRAYLALARAQWSKAARSEAIATLESLQEMAQERRLDRLLAGCLAQQLQFDLAAGDEFLAQGRLLRLDTLAQRHAAVQAGPLIAVHAAALLSRSRLRLAMGDYAAAAVPLAELTQLAEARGQYRLLIQLQVMRAMLDQQQGRCEEADRLMLAALNSGQRLGLVRSFLDAGTAAMAVIARLARNPALDPLLGSYLQRLLRQAPSPDDGRKPATGSVPIEELSTRERAILRALVDCVTNKKIARALNISPETVKWHLKNVYSKLGVLNREEAIARGRDLELL